MKTTSKLFAFFSLLNFSLLGANLSAEIHEYSRRVEFGVEAEAGASNNFLGTSDFFQKDIVIDLQEFYADMPKRGWKTEFFVNERNYFNMDCSGKFRFGFFVGLDGSGYLNFGKDLFAFLSEGIKVGDSYDAEINAYADLYVETGASLRTNIGGLGITLTPSYFVPLVYVPSTTARLRWSTSSSGKMSATADVDLKVYSAIDLEKRFGSSDEEGDSNEKVIDEVVRALSNGGVDLTFEVEYPFIGRVLEAGVYGRVPILPGKLDYEMSKHIYATVATSDNGIVDILNGNSFENEFEVGDTEYSETTHKIHRPIRLGLEGVYRPHGETIYVRPMLGFAIRSPFTNSVKIYPEYSLSGTVKFYNFLGMTLRMAYLNQAFINQVGFMINTHLIELDTGVALRSPNFIRSFKASGASVYIALKFGL